MTLPRPHIPLSVKLRSALIALGLDPDNVDWDHDPPLALRYFDEETGTYQPDANDPRHLKPMARGDHREKTKGDVKQIAARKRAAKAEADKVNRQAARRLGMSEPAAKPKQSSWGKGKPMGRKDNDPQNTATRPLEKTARRF